MSSQEQSRKVANARWIRSHPGAMKLFWTLHKYLFRLSGGRLGSRFEGHDVLLLTTRGRKTGKERTWPLYYFTDGGRLVVIASNGGQDRDPAWWLNLQSNPRALVQARRRKGTYLAQKADPEEKERLWEKIIAFDPVYGEYQKLTSRDIPVVILGREQSDK
jgi:F420H(2)-dependent quinone reductase